jgi:hypothetical protein
MRSINFCGTLIRILEPGDVLSRKHIGADWGRLYVIWSTPDGWNAAERQPPRKWIKLNDEPLNSEQIAFDLTLSVMYQTHERILNFSREVSLAKCQKPQDEITKDTFAMIQTLHSNPL